MVATIQPGQWRPGDYQASLDLARLLCPPLSLRSIIYGAPVSSVQSLLRTSTIVQPVKDGNSLLACSGCKLVYYCSKKCQKAHWRRHKLWCRSNVKAGSSQHSSVGAPKDEPQSGDLNKTEQSLHVEVKITASPPLVPIHKLQCVYVHGPQINPLIWGF
ncbi:hypothetical protein FOMPIDRAFT_1049625 [Fomitopsis schrenkii]|uniref:MYND-type domain-containing protein n=1 Tax=Fomitopsis schrenkii TaxID=2126942 RepID=S8E7D5_FOMSC|nr:hypothetical protein FOMPIDRAFT_1049625 [Fomitopsis schrenkii]